MLLSARSTNSCRGWESKRAAELQIWTSCAICSFTLHRQMTLWSGRDYRHCCHMQDPWALPMKCSSQAQCGAEAGSSQEFCHHQDFCHPDTELEIYAVTCMIHGHFLSEAISIRHLLQKVCSAKFFTALLCAGPMGTSCRGWLTDAT